MAPSILLAGLTPDERHAFVAAQVSDYAAWLVERGIATDPVVAEARAQAEIEPEVEAAMRAGEELWTAHDALGVTVGWLWVKPAVAELPPDSAFLYQILVKPEYRRQGYGIAMLAALEDVLAGVGRRELHLNVWHTNGAGRRLYERAGYEVVGHLPTKDHLCKRLASS